MLFDYLPRFYKNSKVMKSTFGILDDEVQGLEYKSTDAKNQLYIETATWGLEYWETMLGVKTDLSLDHQTRRNILKTKLRGTGVTTKAMLQNVCLSYSGGEVEIIEHFSEYRIIIRFVSLLGVPSNIETLRMALAEIVPCHLAFAFEFKYNTWDMLNDYTWEDLGDLTWDDLPTYERS